MGVHRTYKLLLMSKVVIKKSVVWETIINHEVKVSSFKRRVLVSLTV